MAKVRVTFTVCDVCQDKDRETKPYRLLSEGRRVSVDLCSEHGEPFEAFLQPKDRPRQRRRPMGAKATTVADIEKTKKR